MPIKIDVRTNMEDYELTIEKCSEIITLLQETYTNIRQEMYKYFLGKKSLKRAMLFVVVMFTFYAITSDMVFVYLMPISVLLSMIASIMSAEYITSQSRKQIHEQIQHYIEKKERLLKEQKLKY